MRSSSRKYSKRLTAAATASHAEKILSTGRSKHNPNYKSACDRCRRRKEKCSFTNGASCEGCVRAGTRCLKDNSLVSIEDVAVDIVDAELDDSRVLSASSSQDVSDRTRPSQSSRLSSESALESPSPTPELSSSHEPTSSITPSPYEPPTQSFDASTESHRASDPYSYPYRDFYPEDDVPPATATPVSTQPSKAFALVPVRRDSLDAHSGPYIHTDGSVLLPISSVRDAPWPSSPPEPSHDAPPPQLPPYGEQFCPLWLTHNNWKPVVDKPSYDIFRDSFAKWNRELPPPSLYIPDAPSL